MRLYLRADALSEAEQEAVTKISRVPHSQYQSVATLRAVAVAIQGAGRVRAPSGRVGVLAVAGSHHLGPTWDLLDRVHAGGPTTLNPLAFPATLPSALAATVAASLGANAFAITIGYDDRAPFDAIFRARSLIENDLAHTVVVVAAACGSVPVDRAAAISRLPPPAPIAIAFWVTADPIADSCLLLDLSPGDASLREERLITAHRPEFTMAGAIEICKAISDLLSQQSSGPILVLSNRTPGGYVIIGAQGPSSDDSN